VPKRAQDRAKPVTVSLTHHVLVELDRLVEDQGFTGRSGAVQAAVVQFIAEQRGARPGKREHGALAVCFDARIEGRVALVRHDFADVVRGMLHTHLQGDDCVEVFIVEGSSAQIAKLQAALRALKGVHLVRLAAIPAHDDLVHGDAA